MYCRLSKNNANSSIVNIRGWRFYELWWWENNVKNHEIWIEFPICVKQWRKKTFKIWKWHCHYGVEDWNKDYSLIQTRVLNVVVDLVGNGKEGWKEKNNSSFLGLPKLFDDVSRMRFKVHKKMATRTKREKVERERERENGLKIGKLVMNLSGI